MSSTDTTALVTYRVDLPVGLSTTADTLTITCPPADLGTALLDQLGYRAGYRVDVDLKAGRAVVRDDVPGVDRTYGTATVTVVGEPVKPDYWTGLAADLHQVAERVAALAGTPLPDSSLMAYNQGFYLSLFSGYDQRDSEQTVPVVDAIAAAFGLTAETKTEGRGAGRSTQRKLRGKCGQIRLSAHATMPNPPTRAEALRSRAELAEQNAALQAELAALRAQQATGGAL